MRICRLLAAAVVLLGLAGSSAAATQRFVTRSGMQLLLGKEQFRFGGANIEWLGVAGYGPADPRGPRLPTHYEIDDALSTAQQLGVSVVRSQTMADSVGCDVCIESARGVFNDDAFEPIDYALASARRHGIRIIATIIGDDARDGGGGCVYLRWRGVEVPNCSLVNMEPFWTNADVTSDVEAHIAAVLNHVNRYTHVAYKNDPTILGWDLLNGGGSPRPWTQTIARFVHGIDAHHLVLSAFDNAKLGSVDACVGFIYPHWSLPLARAKTWMAACRRANKPFIAYEYGWDRTNQPTQESLRSFLATLRDTPNLAGDAFWALESHADGHGLHPIPADIDDPVVASTGESGQWWALYWPGIPTLVNSAADMNGRAAIIRAHGFAMRGLPVPALPVPPAPSKPAVVGGRLYWQGSAGAARYSVEHAVAARGPWKTVCDRCVTDRDDGFAVAPGAWFRVVPFNLAGKRGAASVAARS